MKQAESYYSGVRAALARVVTELRGPRRYAAPLNDSKPHWGWLVCLSALCVYIVAVGCMYVFGIVYAAVLRDADISAGIDRGTVAWIFSLGFACFSGGSIVAGKLVGRFSCRFVCVLGGVLVFTGFMLSSFVTTLWPLAITYGLIAGTGCSFSMSVSIIMVQRYFTTRRATATGVAVAGSGLGALILAPIVEAAVARGGWRLACQVLAVIAIMIVPLASTLLVDIEIAPAAERPDSPRKATDSTAHTDALTLHVDHIQVDVGTLVSDTDAQHADAAPASAEAPTTASAVTAASSSAASTSPSTDAAKSTRLGIRALLKVRVFALWLLFVALYGAAWFVVLGHYVNYVRDVGVSPQDAALLVSIQGIANTVGRVGLGVLADRVTASKVVILQWCVFTVGTGLLLLPWLGRYFGYLVVFMLLHGTAGGSIVSLQAPITVDLVGLPSLPVAQGMFNAVQAPFVLFSPPVAGWIRDLTGDYQAVWFLTASIVLVSGVCCHLVHRYHRKDAT